MMIFYNNFKLSAKTLDENVEYEPDLVFTASYFSELAF